MQNRKNNHWISSASDIYKHIRTMSQNSEYELHKLMLIHLFKKEWICNFNWKDKKNYYELCKSNPDFFNKINRIIFNKYNIPKQLVYYDEISPLKSQDLGYNRIIGMVWKMQLNLLLCVKQPTDNITLITHDGIVYVEKKYINLTVNNLTSNHVGVYMYKDYDNNINIILFDVALSKIEDLISVLGID